MNTQQHICKRVQTRHCEMMLSSGQACVIEKCILRVLGQLPTAIKQAHERIIGRRRVKSFVIILSLCDDEFAFIVRGKANAEVDFVNKLTLVEILPELIIDCQLHEGNPADSNFVASRVQRLKSCGLPVSKLEPDRGMFSKSNEALLAANGLDTGYVHATGKKNWLLIGEAQAGQRSVIPFTLIEACRTRDVDPQTYLREVLTSLTMLANRQIKDVTPEAWTKAQRSPHQRQAA